ncbi:MULTISPECIES: DUF418 domain-containing protein [unclassified Dyella]|jgi:uncharacterized protein|uniref:DUF418 domain-containing protein n=1 Tax=unclassified Dyella TaxID=2634549 RepID=UPI003F924FBE
MSDHESMKEARPVGPERRIVAIDVLRGAALFGVLCVNLINEFRVSIFQQFLPASTDGSWLDHAVQATVSIGMELKAFALFSLLFGVGLAIQFERLAATSRRLPLLSRRLLVLLGLGLIHLCFIWNGDILTEYALVGLLALPFLYASNRLLAVAAAVALAIYAALPFWLPDTFFWPSGVSLQQYVQTATAVYAGGTWADVIRFNLAEIPHLIPLHVLVAPRTFALFLLGVMAWRSGLLRHPEHYRRLLVGMAVVGVVLGFAMNLLDPSSAWRSWAPVISVLSTLGPLVLAIGYGAAITVLYMFTRAGRVLGVLGPLGRMAFSNYLAQSLIFGWIFFGYGLGRFGQMSPSHAMGLGVTVYVFQIMASRWWLGRYRFGPMEWLWRTLMYGARQPWRRSTDTYGEESAGAASELK